MKTILLFLVFACGLRAADIQIRKSYLEPTTDSETHAIQVEGLSIYPSRSPIIDTDDVVSWSIEKYIGPNGVTISSGRALYKPEPRNTLRIKISDLAQKRIREIEASDMMWMCILYLDGKPVSRSMCFGTGAPKSNGIPITDLYQDVFSLGIPTNLNLPEKTPNQAPQTTTAAVTDRAFARSAPAAVVSDL